MTKMNKISLLLVLTTFCTGTAIARPSTHGVTIGYATSKYNFDLPSKPKGVNLKYSYTFADSPFGVIVSNTYARSNSSYGKNESLKLDYFSLMAGPSIRATDFLTAYALGGWTNSKEVYNDSTVGASTHTENKVNAFAYGAGLLFNVDNILLDLSYERADYHANSHSNTFTVGVGYRF